MTPQDTNNDLGTPTTDPNPQDPPSPSPEGGTLSTPTAASSASLSTKDYSVVRAIPVRPEEGSGQVPPTVLRHSPAVPMPDPPRRSPVAPSSTATMPGSSFITPTLPFTIPTAAKAQSNQRSRTSPPPPPQKEPYSLDQTALLPYVYWNIARDRKIGVALFRPKGDLIFYDRNFRNLNGSVPPCFSGLLSQLHVNWYQFESFTQDLLDATLPDPDKPGAAPGHTTQTSQFLAYPAGGGADASQKDRNKRNAAPGVARIFVQGTAGRQDNTLVVPKKDKIYRYRIYQIRLTGGQGQSLNDRGEIVTNNRRSKKDENQDLAEAIEVTIEDITAESVDTEVQTRIMDIFHHELNTPALTVDLRCRQLSSQIKLQMQALEMIQNALDELLQEMAKTTTKLESLPVSAPSSESSSDSSSAPAALPFPISPDLLSDIRVALGQSQALLSETRKVSIPHLKAEVRRIVNLAHTLGILLQAGKNKHLNFTVADINTLIRTGVDNGVAEVQDQLKFCNVTFYPLTPAILKSRYELLATRLSYYLAYEIGPKIKLTIKSILAKVKKAAQKSEYEQAGPQREASDSQQGQEDQGAPQGKEASYSEDYSPYLSLFESELERLGRLIVDDIVRVYQGTFWSTSHTKFFATSSIELCFNNIVKNAVKYTAAKYEARNLPHLYLQSLSDPDDHSAGQDSSDLTAPVSVGNAQGQGRVIIRIGVSDDNFDDARGTLKDFLGVYLKILEDQYLSTKNLVNLSGLPTEALIKKILKELYELVAGYPFPADTPSGSAVHPEGTNPAPGTKNISADQDQGRPGTSWCNTESLLIHYFHQNNKILIFYKNLEITVSDNGKGIINDERKYVFGLGYRGDKSGNARTGGMGIGLKLAKIVTSYLDGDIMIEDCMEPSLIPASNPGGKPYWWDGTTFRITLPTVERLASEIQQLSADKDENFLRRVSDDKQIYHKFYDFLLNKDAAVRGVTRILNDTQPQVHASLQEEPSGLSLYSLLRIWMCYLKDNNVFRMDQQIVPSKKVEESLGKVSD